MPSTQPRFVSTAPNQVDVAIVGGGFSGMMSLVHVMRALPDARVALFERVTRSGPGVAYGACGSGHLLNVPADRMSAFPEDPRGFVSWLEGEQPGRHRCGSFVSRSLYGRYLLSVVQDALSASRKPAAFVRASALRLHDNSNGTILELASGQLVSARFTILALGIPPARPRWITTAGDMSPCVVRDPWTPGALSEVGEDDSVIIVGTGLTALDMLVSLDHRRHRGAIVLVSRSGRLPLPHPSPEQRAIDPRIDLTDMTAGPRRALRAVRRLAQESMACGRPWQHVIDALRPHANTIWRAWSNAERTRFLRWVRPFWEIHRHRAPAETLRRIDRGLAGGRIAIARGVVECLELVEPSYRIKATIRTASSERRLMEAQWIVNCTGPSMSLHDSCDPLVRSMCRGGVAVLDANGLGLCTDHVGRLIRANGTASRRTYLIGALRRGDLWESTAVPELRHQAALVGQAIASAAKKR